MQSLVVNKSEFEYLLDKQFKGTEMVELPGEKIAGELIKPVYEDLAKPAVRQIGEHLAIVVRLLGFPIRLLQYKAEKLETRFLPNLEEKAKSIPHNRLVEPPHYIAGPVLEAAAYTASEPLLSELFQNLLLTAMDSETIQNGHPSFVEIIKQLCPDEARIIRLFYKLRRRDFPIISIHHRERYGGESAKSFKIIKHHFSLLGEEAGCEFSEPMPRYIDNLCRLRIVEIVEARIHDDSSYDALVGHPDIVRLVEELNSDKNWEARINKEILAVTEYGTQFCRACVR